MILVAVATALLGVGVASLAFVGDGRDADPVAARRRPTTTTAPPTTTTIPPATTTTTTPPPPPPPAPSTAGDPATLAAQIATIETAIRTPTTPLEHLAGWGHAQQVSYRTLSDNPTWMDAVLARVPPDLHPAVRANTAANHSLRALSKRPRTELPKAWRIVAPASAIELLGYYKAAEGEFGVPWNYLAAIHLVETRMGRIRGVSSAGAQGPMQFMPQTWAAYGEGDIQSNKDSIRAAARYLKANNAPADLRSAVWNYNHSYHYVDAVQGYANEMARDERAYFAYHGWQVYYWTVNGDVLLHEGWASPGY